MKPSLDLHIETLVLDGLPTSDGPALRAAIERELTRLLGDQGLPASLAGARDGHGIDRVDGGTVAPALGNGTGRPAAELGRQVASAIYRGIGR